MDFKKKYFDIWMTAWNFHKHWCNNCASDEEWDSIVDEIGEILKKFEGKPELPFVDGLVLAVVNELERIGKEREMEQNGET